MPLPNDFSPWEHLQNTIRNAHNQQVRKEFDDIQVDDDINTARGSLKVASLIDDKDTSSMVIARLFLYHIIIKGDDAMPYYSIPISSAIETLRFKPQIELNFSQNLRDVEDNNYPVRSEIKIRLANETNTSITPAEAQRFATKIKSLFGVGNGFKWHRGKGMFTYSDMEKGYNFQLLVFDKAEGRKIVEQVLDIQSHTPDWKNSFYKENEEPLEAYPNIPPTKIVYGKSRKGIRKRPICFLYFRSAFLHIEGVQKPIVLYDKTNYYKKALLSD
jgi:hypothetical protein